MKKIFIPAKSNLNLDGNKIKQISEKLPKKIAIAYSIQYQKNALELKEILSKNHEITKFTQVLGCSNPNFSKGTQAVLMIGSGKFHGISLSLKSKIPVYLLENNELNLISKKDIESFEKKQKTSYLKFLNSEEVGILISTKSGQQNLKKALEIKKSLKEKKSYIFLANEINKTEFENFSLKSWINTACPRLDMDFFLINLGDLNNLLF